jgi:D-alanine transfer protein
VPLRAFNGERLDGHAYAANFSRLHAGELAFNPRLSFALKQAAARRLLAVPDTLEDDPLLRFALERLAGGTIVDRLLYTAAVPLGMLRNAILRLQDHWETLAFLRGQVGLAPVTRRAGTIDWTTELARADAESRRQATNNPFRFADAFWVSHATEIVRQKGSYDPNDARRDIERAAEWDDLDLLLRGIRELGAEPLLVSVPLNDAYYDHLGVPFEVRRGAAEQLRRIATAHGLRVVDFEGGGGAEYLTVDPSAHLSEAGWVRVDQALDEFFHRGSDG